MTMRNGGSFAPLRARPGFSRKSFSSLGTRSTLVALGVLLALLSACSKEPAAKEPIVPVQVAPVEKKTIEHTVAAQAVLFPLAQSAIVPKISSPVKTFL